MPLTGVLTTEGREASAQLNLIVLDGLWNLLNTFYNQVPMKPLDSSWYGEELECLLLSVKLYSNTHLSSTFSNDSVVRELLSDYVFLKNNFSIFLRVSLLL